MTLIRLQKFMAAAGVCSRRHAEALIVAGRVRVNGVVVTILGTRIDPEADRITVDGKAVSAAADRVYLVLNKPAGYVTSCRHPGERIVLELVDLPQRIFPVGRLDKDSTGLLLLTDDGRIHHLLSHPSFDHEKEYEVTVARPIPDAALARLAKGMPILGARTRPARVKRTSANRFRIVLQEGKNRQIRRMVRKVENRVVTLCRIRMAHIRLGTLPEGKWRHLTPPERSRLMAMIDAATDGPLPAVDGSRKMSS